MRPKGKRIETSKPPRTKSTAPGGKKRLTKTQKRKRIAVVTALSIVIFLFGVFMVVRHYVRPPEGGVMTPDPSSFPSDYPALEGMPENLVADQDIITMLIVGLNEYNTDTIMVASIDLNKQKVKAVSIPRDTIVGTTNRSLKKINGAYSHGARTGDDAKERAMNGYKQLQQEVSTLVGYSPRYYVGVDVKGFVELVDLIDGVDFDVPTRMYKGGSQLIDLQPGMQHLNGTQALMLVRFRGYGSNSTIYDSKAGTYHDDFGRMKTQQEFLKVVAKKCVSELDLRTAKGYLDIANQHLVTNMNVGQMGGLVENVYSWIDKEGNLSFATLPTVSVRTPSQAAKDRYKDKYGSITGSYYEQVIADEALALINEMINPFDQPITWVEYLNINS